MTEAKDKNWPAWFYGPRGEAEIFESEADVPEGWLDSPGKHGQNLDKAPPEAPAAPPLSRKDIIAGLKERGVTCDVKLTTRALYEQLAALPPVAPPEPPPVAPPEPPPVAPPEPPPADTPPNLSREEIIAGLVEREAPVDDALSTDALYEQLVALVDAES